MDGAFSWPRAAESASAKFSLNRTEQRCLLILVACGLSGVMAEDQYPLLIYCGDEGGTDKSRVIFTIQYMLDLRLVKKAPYTPEPLC